ncbi:transmembrane protein, putative [Bodo saltans]|uniref:Transmembrane protein, putative n=1 Tax=Bodo saltans TaxID=75058 RepID=A0A0S4JAY8_BODSA|nr:transmembrane protein, putative [Bodo saltans]|eukprot:CUG86587.1 transmembrane protein, putative [Bodo saltans]
MILSHEHMSRRSPLLAATVIFHLVLIPGRCHLPLGTVSAATVMKCMMMLIMVVGRAVASRRDTDRRNANLLGAQSLPLNLTLLRTRILSQRTLRLASAEALPAPDDLPFQRPQREVAVHHILTHSERPVEVLHHHDQHPQLLRFLPISPQVSTRHQQ